MEYVLNISLLQRNADKVKSNLTELEDGSVVTKVRCEIHIPERFTACNLATIGNNIYILGFFPIIMEGEYYGLVKTTAMIRIDPSTTERVKIGDTTYYVFGFLPGDVLIKSSWLVKNAQISYYIYNELVAKGNMPWYFNYFDALTMFDTLEEHAGVNLGTRAITEIIISTTMRDPQDISRLYRHVIKQQSDVITKPPIVIPFNSVIWNTSDTVSKLNGSYFSDAVNSALVSPSEQVEMIEEFLRT